jgi:hypothetical protein
MSLTRKIAALLTSMLLSGGLSVIGAQSAGATTSVVLSIPTTSQVTLLRASSDGRYVSYLMNASASDGTLQELHWYDTQTATDIAVARVSLCVRICGRHQWMSADGHHLVFVDWPCDTPSPCDDPDHPGLVQGTVYEANIDDTGTVTYAQVSPVTAADGSATDGYSYPSVNGDGSLVAYNGVGAFGVYVWNADTNVTTNLADFGVADPIAQLSDDGTVIATSGGNDVQENSPFSGAPVRTMDFGGPVNVATMRISADGAEAVAYRGGPVTGENAAGLVYVGPQGVQLIPNSWNPGGCVSFNPIVISADGQAVLFSSFTSNGLAPDPGGTQFAYFGYDPSTQQSLNESGGFGGEAQGLCPSGAMSTDGQTVYFLSYHPPAASMSTVTVSPFNREIETSVTPSNAYVYTTAYTRAIGPPPQALCAASGSLTFAPPLASASLGKSFTEHLNVKTSSCAGIKSAANLTSAKATGRGSEGPSSCSTLAHLPPMTLTLHWKVTRHTPKDAPTMMTANTTESVVNGAVTLDLEGTATNGAFAGHTLQLHLPLDQSAVTLSTQCATKKRLGTVTSNHATLTVF